MNKQDGYIVDTAYPVYFYKEMQPLWLKTIVSFLGFNTPEMNKGFSYLELGCATGINLLLNAVHYPNAHFIGVDFNQQHIEKAKQLAVSLGLENIEFIHCSFSEFLKQNTLKFDFIVNHGTYSWISKQHQQGILQAVKKNLNKSGIFYLHYMCYPGSAQLQPIQKLLHLVDDQMQDSSFNSIELGKKLFFDLNEAGAFVDQANINPILNVFKNNNAYLAHEFLTDHWQPLYSTDVHSAVHEAAQMSYLGSANPCDNFNSISIPAKMQPIIQQTQAPALREYLKDLARNAKQRVDIFQKNPQVLAGDTHLKTIYQTVFKLLPNAPKQGSVCFKTAIGDINAPEEVISPLLKTLARQDASFAQLAELAAFKNNPVFLIETLFLLMNAQYIYPLSLDTKYAGDKTIEHVNEQLALQNIPFRLMYDCTAVI